MEGLSVHPIGCRAVYCDSERFQLVTRRRVDLGGAVCLASGRFLVKISRLESRTGGVYRVAVENEADVVRGDPCDDRADECDKAENVSLFIFQRQN